MPLRFFPKSLSQKVCYRKNERKFEWIGNYHQSIKNIIITRLWKAFVHIFYIVMSFRFVDFLEAKSSRLFEKTENSWCQLRLRNSRMSSKHEFNSSVQGLNQNFKISIPTKVNLFVCFFVCLPSVCLLVSFHGIGKLIFWKEIIISSWL